MKALLKDARLSKGYGTREIAKLLKIDPALISKFESGQRTPTKEQVIKLAALLEIDLDTLMLAWLKTKILTVIADEKLGLAAIQAVESELNPTAEINPDQKAIDELFDEMNALRSKMESLRKPSGN
jgi:transcriptional regulator with XRE-family HTH domain